MRFAPVAVSLIAVLLLCGCFVSRGLLKEQRIWDPAWQGRYTVTNAEYVVLAADPERRTYLVGQQQKSEFQAFRAAIYPGWDDVLIVGVQRTSSADANHLLYRVHSKDKVESLGAACVVPKGSGKSCTFTSIDALREAMKESHNTQTKDANSRKQPPPSYMERVDTKLSTINALTELATLEDGDGVHGMLRITQQGSLPASVGLGDFIVAVNGERATTGGELLLRIAFERPGSSLKLTVLDAETKREFDVDVKTDALN